MTVDVFDVFNFLNIFIERSHDFYHTWDKQRHKQALVRTIALSLRFAQNLHTNFRSPRKFLYQVIVERLYSPILLVDAATVDVRK